MGTNVLGEPQEFLFALLWTEIKILSGSLEQDQNRNNSAAASVCALAISNHKL